MERIYRQIEELVGRSQSIVVAAHYNPEGDAIGSTLALFLALLGMGKKVTAYNQDPVPQNLRFLPAAERIVGSVEELGNPDLLFIIDCGELERVGKRLKEFAANRAIINIDHHATSEQFGTINLIQPAKSSTGEILYELFKALAWPITAEVAVCLYTAIVTDTGSFHFPNTSPTTLRIAAELMEAGAKPAEIARQVFDIQPAKKLRLLARALSTMQLSPDGSRAEMLLSKQMFEETGTTAEAAEGFINHLVNIEGVKVAILFRDMGHETFKASFRSPGLVDVARVAQSLGGGGHREAAGATLHGTLEDVRRQVYKALGQALGGQTSK